jgi:hypothetical protein
VTEPPPPPSEGAVDVTADDEDDEDDDDEPDVFAAALALELCGASATVNPAAATTAPAPAMRDAVRTRSTARRRSSALARRVCRSVMTTTLSCQAGPDLRTACETAGSPPRFSRTRKCQDRRTRRRHREDER